MTVAEAGTNGKPGGRIGSDEVPDPDSRVVAPGPHNDISVNPSDAMSDPRLRSVVEEMRAQLASAEGLPPATRRSLEQLVRDLDALADPSGLPPDSSASLRDRATDAVRRLEASHPVLSTTLGNVVDALAFFGL